MPINVDKRNQSLSEQQKQILQYVKANGKITSNQTGILLQVKQRRARIILGEMADAGILKKEGAYRTTVYVLKK